MDDEHVFALVEAIDGADLDAIHQLALDAGFIDDISQMSSSLWKRYPITNGGERHDRVHRWPKTWETIRRSDDRG